MNFRMTYRCLFVLIAFLSGSLKARYSPQPYLITVNLDAEKLVGMQDIALLELLNNKIENERQNVLGMFNTGLSIPLRIIIYKDDQIIFASTFYNKEKLFDDLNSLLWRLNKF